MIILLYIGKGIIIFNFEVYYIICGIKNKQHACKAHFAIF